MYSVFLLVENQQALVETLAIPISVKTSSLSIPETATTPNIIEGRITNVGCRFVKVTSKSKLRREDEILT